jgi:hypothetical protein
VIGIDLRQQFLDALNQDQEDLVLVDLRRIYNALDMAAGLYVRETRGIRSEAVIATVAGQQAYDLPSDFKTPAIRQQYGRLRRKVAVAKYVYDGNTAWVPMRSYEAVFRLNRTDNREVPGCFAVRSAAATKLALTGTATADGPLAAGEVTLTDAAADFTASVSPRDVVVNTARNSSGVVLEVTDGRNIQCAMFPEGINSWRNGDGYRIQPEARPQVFLDAPSAVSGHTLTLPYIAQPAPVFADNRGWRLDDIACRAIAFEAAFLFSLSNPKIRTVSGHHDIFVDAVKAERRRLALRSLEGV